MQRRFRCSTLLCSLHQSSSRGSSCRRLTLPRFDGDLDGNDGSGLPLPTVVYSDNHLLVVNKPAGWHSVPNRPSNIIAAERLVDVPEKCIVTKLKSMRLGGGSQSDFLLPLHRIDQPCTGLLILGKTSKAASRITNLWKQKRVEKEYLCVVPSQRLGMLVTASTPLRHGSAAAPSGAIETSLHSQMHGEGPSGGNVWYELRGLMLRQRPNSRSVAMVPVSGLPLSPLRAEEIPTRKVELLWRIMKLKTSSSAPSENPSNTLILVRTFEGARHMVRALLAQIGRCPIEGDVRYQQSSMDTAVGFEHCSPLQDRSVALHAFRIRLDSHRLKLGSLETFEFQAPIPATWKYFFGICQDAI
jgi:23S rRNA-/tRNA-specific pseudouridylate synthase